MKGTATVPHVSIKHFTRTFTEAEKADLVASMTGVVTRVFDTEPGTVSIAVESVDPAEWMTAVHAPDIAAKQHQLWKRPDYGSPLPIDQPENEGSR
ncbi:tautomerase family protein [Actinoplanes flavus]|uniref:Tautomerase family protein n=1 Tax=Actinoplanes flavus TaxID=2820290 RepID=A0ABS3UB09_9ACTN|nr:tautomerase family protein [Actinoplanes flavus]MBO3735952.1 tautomerase family protein [Actinoplanes flavus]